MKMLSRFIFIAALLITSSAQARNFTGNPDLVAKAEEARIKSALFWTGKELKDWDEPVPILWERGTGDSSSGLTSFNYKGGKAKVLRIQMTGPIRKAMSNALVHEVDHAVRHTIIGKKIPRWLDEGCAQQLESKESKDQIRSALIHGNLKASIWDMLGAEEYPRDEDGITAFYSGSASMVEWMLEMSSPKDLMKLQELGMSSAREWKMYVGEDIATSRQRYEKWFAAKYLAGNRSQAEEDILPSEKYVDVWVSADFDCQACDQFLAYAHSTDRKERGFDYHIHRITYDECARRGIAVPLFVVKGARFEGNIKSWADIDEWGRKHLGVNKVPPPPKESDPMPESDPIIPNAPALTVSPEALEIFTQVLNEKKEQPEQVNIEWEDLEIVIAISDQNPAIAIAGEGPGRRAIERLVGGKARVVVISERRDPELFRSYEKSLGLDITLFHVSVLVPSFVNGNDLEMVPSRIEVMLNNNVSNHTREKIDDIPVELIMELVSPQDYKKLTNVLVEREGSKDEHESVTTNISDSVLIASVVLFILTFFSLVVIIRIRGRKKT